MTQGTEASDGSTSSNSEDEEGTGWLAASWTLVNATQGSCPLPFVGLAYMGWVGGSLVMAVFALISLLSAMLLIQMTEINGKRIRTYIELGEELWGKRGKRAVAILQMTYLVLFAIVNTIFMAQGMQFAQRQLCTATGGGAGCQAMRLTYWTLIAGGLQLTTAFVPSMAAAAWTSLIGIITVAVFLVMVITVAFMTHPAPGTCYAPLIQGPAERCHGLCIMGFFNGMGGIVLSASLAQTVLVEIAAPVARPPKVSTTMTTAVLISAALMTVINYLGAVAGFRAFGTEVATTLLFSLNIMPMVVGVATCFFLVSTLANVVIMNEPVYYALERTAIRLYKNRAARRSTNAAAVRVYERKDSGMELFTVDDPVSISVGETSSIQVGRALPSLRMAATHSVSGWGELPLDKHPLHAGLSEFSAPAVANGAANGSTGHDRQDEGAIIHGGGTHAHVHVPLWVRVLSRYPLRLLYLGLVAFTAILLPFVGDFMGVIAAVGSIPLELIFPILMYLTYKAQQGVTVPFHIKAGLGIVVVLCAGIAAIMLVASLYMIADSASSYRFFS